TETTLKEGRCLLDMEDVKIVEKQLGNLVMDIENENDPSGNHRKDFCARKYATFAGHCTPGVRIGFYSVYQQSGTSRIPAVIVGITAAIKPSTYDMESPLKEVICEPFNFTGRPERERKGLRSMLALLPLLGVTYILGYFLQFHIAVQYLFVLLNSTQGVTFTIFHYVFDDQESANTKKKTVTDMNTLLRYMEAN
ncbi:unnamed protein product, partial [Porites lobata]